MAGLGPRVQLRSSGGNNTRGPGEARSGGKGNWLKVRLEGPAVVTQYDTIIFITPRFAFWADARGNIRAEVKS